MPKLTVEVIENPVLITTDNENIVVEINEEIVTVDVGVSGPQGPQGIPGEVQLVDLSYIHNQNTPSATWTINHGLQFIPGITVIDSGGSVVEGSYEYPNANTIIANFSGAFSGKAYLS